MTLSTTQLAAKFGVKIRTVQQTYYNYDNYKGFRIIGKIEGSREKLWSDKNV